MTELQERKTAPKKQKTVDDGQDDGTDHPMKIVWRNVLTFTYLHIAAAYGLWLGIMEAQYKTIFFAFMLYVLGALGVTAGSHRLWSHRSYKAKLPLRIFLAVCQTLAFQNSIYDWARDHRVHHKFSETDADPHNAKRGFFFSHVGWLLVRKHPKVIEKGNTIDLSDLKKDPVVVFQRRYYHLMVVLVCFVLPTVIPWFLMSESLKVSFFVCALFRYCYLLHVTWLVNSAAHLWGNKPYDKYINPSENIGVTLGALGEGWHNYHHVFPWDYRAAELPMYNPTAMFIDCCAKVGLAYDRKSVSDSVIKERILRTGDGTHNKWGQDQ